MSLPGPAQAARSRWIGRPRLQDRENTLEAGQRAGVDASGFPRKALPPHLDARLQRRIKGLVWDHDMLLSLTARMAAIPKTRVAEEEHSGRRAGIMLPLCSVDGKPGVLFNLRSMSVGTHKGQVRAPFTAPLAGFCVCYDMPPFFAQSKRLGCVPKSDLLKSDVQDAWGAAPPCTLLPERR